MKGQHKLAQTRQVLALLATLTTLPAVAQTIDPSNRTVTTSNFSLSWYTGVDTEAVTALQWMGGSNLTGAIGLSTCNGGSPPDSLGYSGNSWAPPDPYLGGLVLVGGGTVTPPGELPWTGRILQDGILEVTINSNSTNCPPASAGVNVQTTYRFLNPANSEGNRFQVQRVFDFTNVPFPYDFRPYLPRLNLSSAYTEVLYPTISGALQTTDVSGCPAGCTGPQPGPGASALNPPWNSAQNWFAINDPTTLQGVVIKRENSTDPQGNAIVGQLWIDDDGGPPPSNPSSFLLLTPPLGFYGGLVTEVDTLCFYNGSIWKPSLVAPAGCRDAPLVMSPPTLTFPAQSVGSDGAPQQATLKNTGTAPVQIFGIKASGDFGQTNDCPEDLLPGDVCIMSVTFKPSASGIRSGSVCSFDQLESSPTILTLAGLGVSTP